MTIHLEIPQEAEKYLGDLDHTALNRKLLEGTAAEAYRQRKIGTAGVRKILGFENHWDTIEFLATFKAYPNYNEDDLEEDRANLEKIRSCRRFRDEVNCRIFWFRSQSCLSFNSPSATMTERHQNTRTIV